jgi:hypothetical protein
MTSSLQQQALHEAQLIAAPSPARWDGSLVKALRETGIRRGCY